MVIFVTRCTQLDAYKNKLFLPKKREREREREREKEEEENCLYLKRKC